MVRVAAVVLSSGAGRELLDRVHGLRRQGRQGIQVVLVDTGEVGAMARRVVDALREEPEVDVVGPGEGRTPGAWRNAGVAATSAQCVFFLEAGYRLGPDYCETAVAELAGTEGLGFVTSWVESEALAGVGGGSSGRPEDVDLATLLGEPDAIHPCTVFRRSLWEELGGFDEDLKGLELYDFWLRAAAAGTAGSVLPRALVTHDLTASSYRRDLERERRLPAVSAVFHKHRALFEEHPGAVLVARERALYDLDARYRPLMARRQAAEREVEELNDEIRHLTALLEEQGRDRVDWGDLRRTTPLSAEWGADRGSPVDRYYIEEFLSRHAPDVRGTVLEVQEADYTRAFGGEQVEVSDVVDLDPTNPRATVITDLRRAGEIPSDIYDCFILTQTLHVIDDMRAVLRECVRILKPGGVLLTTFPCLSRVCLEYGADGDFWRLTEAGVRNLLYEFFAPGDVETRSYGNVLTATAFLYGLSCEELTDEEFAAYDPYHPVLVGARAVKAGGAHRDRPSTRPARRRQEAVVLGYHRVARASCDPHAMCVAPEEFRRQMELVCRHYEPMELTCLVDRAQAGDLPPRAVAVTFDDGYIDALTTASPILCELGVAATFFVSTASLDGRWAFWWDSLANIFLSQDELPRHLELSTDGGPGRFTTATAAERREAHQALYTTLLHAPPAQRDAVLRHLGRWSGKGLSPSADRRAMNREELRDLAGRPGHAVGAHTVHHLALSRQPFDTQRSEIMEGKSALERLLEEPVTAFAYPYGDLCEEAVRLVRAAAFRIAVTCDETDLPSRVDPYRMPRWMVPRVGGEPFEEWLAGRFDRDGRPWAAQGPNPLGTAP